MSSVEWYEHFRGVEVLVKASSFDGDASVGIPYGPEEICAEDLDGQVFELTPEEEAACTITAMELMEDRSCDYE